MNTLSIIISIIPTVVLLIISIIVAVLILSELKKKRKLAEMKYYTELYQANDNINKILDEFIHSAVDDYRVRNVNLFEEYINDKVQVKMINEIMEYISIYISPLLINHLELMYDKNHISTIIKNKVILEVIAITIEVNEQIEL